MKIIKRIKKLTVVLALSVLTLGAVSAVAAPGIPVFFTQNIQATGTSQTVTTLEQALLTQINSAQTSIDLAIYDFNRQSVRDALISAANRGVTIRLVTDDDARLNPSYQPHFAAVEAAGVTIVDDGRPADIMHNKFAIFDQVGVWSGSTNLTDNGFSKNHNNALFIESAPLAEIYGREFNQMFGGNFSTSKTASLTNTVTLDTIPIEIYFSPKDNAVAEMIAEISGASTEITFAIFFLTDDGVRDALISAHQRGVSVRGVWDLLGASNAYSDDEALCAAGIPIKIETWIGKMHHKFMVIDPAGPQPRLITGSMNWTGAGGRDNDENTLIIHEAQTAQAFATAFNDLYNALPDESACVAETVTFIAYLPLTVAAGDPLPAAPIMEIKSIVYDPAGADIDGEWVEIVNRGTVEQDLSGWSLADEVNTTFTFPAVTLPPNGTILVWVKTGVDDVSNLYWGRGAAVWNNSGDVATLRNDAQEVIDQCAYSGGGTTASCP